MNAPVLAKLWKPLLLLAGLVLAGTALRWLRTHGVFEGGFLEREFVARGGWGEVLFVAAGALATAIGLPRQIVAFAGGTAFGALIGTGLALLASVFGCIAGFLWARLVGRDWARRRISGRLARLDRFLAENPFSATLTLRLLPVGNNAALNLLAGLSGVRLLPFVAGSAIGYVPQTVVFALLGKGVRVEGWMQLTVGIAMFAGSALLGLWLLRRSRKAAEMAEAAAGGE